MRLLQAEIDALKSDDDIGTIICEVSGANYGSVPLAEGFLSELRRLADEHNAVLIFDEVVTGFRLAYGGGQEYFGVTPDIAAYGKIAGGGASLGAVAGKAEIIDFADPARRGNGDYAQINGTLHGNPLASAAGLATLMELRKPSFYDDLNAKADDLRKVLQSAQQVVPNRLQVPKLNIPLQHFSPISLVPNPLRESGLHQT